MTPADRERLRRIQKGAPRQPANDIVFLLRLLDERGSDWEAGYDAAIDMLRTVAADMEKHGADKWHADYAEIVKRADWLAANRPEKPPCDHHWIGGNDGMWCTKCKEEKPPVSRDQLADEDAWDAGAGAGSFKAGVEWGIEWMRERAAQWHEDEAHKWETAPWSSTKDANEHRCYAKAIRALAVEISRGEIPPARSAEEERQPSPEALRRTYAINLHTGLDNAHRNIALAIDDALNTGRGCQ